MKKQPYSPTNFRPFIRVLKLQGFALDFDSRAGGARCAQYVKAVDNRRSVNVQLWEGGHHRASHSFVGCCDTAPTDFTTISSMIDAIKHETERTDGRYCNELTAVEKLEQEQKNAETNSGKNPLQSA